MSDLEKKLILLNFGDKDLISKLKKYGTITEIRFTQKDTLSVSYESPTGFCGNVDVKKGSCRRLDPNTLEVIEIIDTFDFIENPLKEICYSNSDVGSHARKPHLGQYERESSNFG